MKRLSRVSAGHHFARVLAGLAKKITIETAVRRANRYALDRIVNIKRGSRGGVYTTPQDFKKAIEKPPKDTKLTEEELAKIGVKLDQYSLIVPSDEAEEIPLLQNPTGLAALGWFNEPLLPVVEQPQVLDDDELEEVLNEPAGKENNTVRKDIWAARVRTGHHLLGKKSIAKGSCRCERQSCCETPSNR
jgi:hypothetical protein